MYCIILHRYSMSIMLSSKFGSVSARSRSGPRGKRVIFVEYQGSVPLLDYLPFSVIATPGLVKIPTPTSICSTRVVVLSI